MGTTSREEAIRALDSYFHALVSHDLSGVPLATDVVFKRPTGGQYHGIDEVMQFLSNLTWLTIRIEAQIIDGDQCASLFDYDRPDGTIMGCDYFRLEDGKIKEIRPYLNPINAGVSPNP